MGLAIDDLRHEHDAILSALVILDRMADTVATGGHAERADLLSFIDFLREFVDQCHHGKEEGLLFPALAQAGIPQQGGPLSVLLDEHVQGRQWIRQMQASVEPALDPVAFAGAARGYRELLQAHIRKENEVLFPWAERVLGPQQLQGLSGAFEAHEARVMGPGRHEQLQALKDRYLLGA